ncbi:hypothetical protein JCM11491_005239 [Sporobolomyces phaffii]
MLEPILLLLLCLVFLHYWHPPPPPPPAAAFGSRRDRRSLPPLPTSHHLAKKLVKHKCTLKRKGWPRTTVHVAGVDVHVTKQAAKKPR